MPQRPPLIRSGVLLRGIATAVTLTSLASMNAFAAAHVQNDAAPLKPAASTTTASTATATATPASTAVTTTSRTTTVTGRVATTTTTARTKTHSS